MSDAGISAHAIAKAVGRSKGYVLKRIPLLQFQKTTNLDKIISLGRSGHSIKVIAQRTSTDACAIVYHLRMNGVEVDDMDTIAVWLHTLGHPMTNVQAASGYSYSRLRKLLEEKGVEVRANESSPLEHEDFFKKIDTPAKAYWLGFICADGNVSADGGRVQIKLHERDHEHLEKFAQVLGYGGTVEKHNAVTNFGAYTFSQLDITSPRLNADLVAHGCTANKTDWLDEPVGVPADLRTHFIRGMVDGDGSIVMRAGKSAGIKLYGTQRIVRWASSVIPGGRVRLHSGQTWEAQWNGVEAIKRIYEGADEECRMGRKYDRVKELLV